MFADNTIYLQVVTDINMKIGLCLEFSYEINLLKKTQLRPTR